MMKKLISGFMAAAVAICSVSGVFAANDTRKYSETGTITIKSSANKTTSIQFKDSEKIDFTKLMSLTNISAKNVTEEDITITSNTGRVADGNVHPFIPVDMMLVIEIPANETKSKQNIYNAEQTLANAVLPASEASDKYTVADNTKLVQATNNPRRVNTSTVSAVASSYDDTECSPFEYYNLTVYEGSKVIFSAEDIPADVTELDIPLSVFNKDNEDNTNSKNYSDSRTYTISLQEDNKLDKSSVQNYALPSRWTWSVYAEQNPDITGIMPTASPKAAENIAKATAYPKQTQTPEKTTVPQNNKQTDYNLKKGEYIVGKDIVPGRYYVVGQGMLETYDEDGNLTGNIDLSAATKSTGYHLMMFKEGEIVSVSDDTELHATVPKNSVVPTARPKTTPRVRATVTPKATPKATSKATPKATSTPKATATPKPTATPKATATPKPTPTPKATDTQQIKTNPKTGDAAPIAVLSVVGILAICAIVVIQFKKRKSN